MRKLFVLLVALFLATSAWAFNETADNGPQLITVCYVKGIGALVSGDVVVLQTASPTYYGKEVTQTTTAGLPIYGVVVGSGCEEAAGNAGTYVRVQTYGYCSIVNLRANSAVTATTATSAPTGSSILVTSSSAGDATACEELNNLNADTSGNAVVTGNSVALESVSDGFSGTTSMFRTFKAFLK